MRVKTLSLLILFIIIGGGILFFKKTTLLSIKNIDTSKAIHIRIVPGDRFSILYIHSIYKEPVIEEFLIDKDSIVLIGVKTKSPAVMEYYGFEDTKEFQKMNIKLGEFFFLKRGMGQGQRLIIKDRKIYLSELGDEGERIQIRIKRVFFGKYMISKFFLKIDTQE